MDKAYTEVTEATRGRPQKNKKLWITEESWSLVHQREEINKKSLGSERLKQLKAKYAEKDRETKRFIKTDKINGWRTLQVRLKKLQENNK